MNPRLRKKKVSEPNKTPRTFATQCKQQRALIYKNKNDFNQSEICKHLNTPSSAIIRASCLFSLLCECLIRTLNQDFSIFSQTLIVFIVS